MEDEEDGHDELQQVINSTLGFSTYAICLKY